MVDMRTILLAVALMGCGTNGPHDVVTCGSGWLVDSTGASATTSSGCERECETPPPGIGVAMDPPLPRCNVMDANATTGTRACTPFTTADGVMGCCLSDPGKVLAFAECTN